MEISEGEWDPSISPGYAPDIYWSVVLKDLKTGSDSVMGGKDATAFLDTGASLIQGPYDEVALLAKKIGATCISLEFGTSDGVRGGYRVRRGGRGGGGGGRCYCQAPLRNFRRFYVGFVL